MSFIERDRCVAEGQISSLNKCTDVRPAAEIRAQPARVCSALGRIFQYVPAYLSLDGISPGISSIRVDGCCYLTVIGLFSS